MNIDWIHNPIPKLDENSFSAALRRQDQLTKPPGSLGRLEHLASRMAAMQGNPTPTLDNIQISIFAGDHGVTEEGISAFPQSVTVEMIKNFSAGGAAISVLAEQHQATLEVINTGTANETPDLPGVINEPVAAGTANMTHQSAMGRLQLIKAINLGRDAIYRAIDRRTHCYIAGEMGIGNTTSATALIAALTSEPVNLIVGSGTGLTKEGVAHKQAVIEKALALHREQLEDPIATLRCLGGFEIAALTGSYIAAAQAKIPILVDGFITSAAALCATRIAPEVLDWMIFSHQSAEPGHIIALQHLDAEPLLALEMRLGEGSGAAVALSLLKSACQLHNKMATFATAGVSEKLS